MTYNYRWQGYRLQAR